MGLVMVDEPIAVALGVRSPSLRCYDQAVTLIISHIRPPLTFVGLLKVQINSKPQVS